MTDVSTVVNLSRNAAGMPTLTRDDLLQRDRLLRFWLDLIRPGGSSSASMLLLMIAVPLVVTGVAALLEGRFFLGKFHGTVMVNEQAYDVVGMSYLGDTMVWPFMFLIPIQFCLLNVIIGRFARVLDRADRVVSADWLRKNQDTYADIVRKVGRITSGDGDWVYVRWFAMAVGLVFFLFNTITCTSPAAFDAYAAKAVVLLNDKGLPVPFEFMHAISIPKWDTDVSGAPLSWLTARIWVLVLGYAWIPLILYKVFNLVAATWVYTRELGKHDGSLRIIPLAPKAGGGLSILSDLAMSFIYPMVVIGIMVVLAFMKESAPASPHNFLLLVLAIPVFLIVFFAPLISVHDAMRDAKDRQWHDLSLLFDKINARLKSDRAKNDPKLESQMKWFSEYYTKIERMPVWPFNVATLSQLTSAIALPMLLFALQSLVKGWLE